MTWLWQWTREEPLMSSNWTSVRPLTWVSMTSLSPNWKYMNFTSGLHDGTNCEIVGQWLNVQMEISYKWCPSNWSVLGPMLFHIFVTDIDSGIECTVSKFTDDTKLCDMWCSWHIWETGYLLDSLDMLKWWAQENLMRFNKSKSKVLHLGHGNPHYQYKLGDARMEQSCAERAWW